ncbi:MAG: DUF3313 domain-containing protein [Planctomycetes bacterium]|nr:DUF3313 domain-containing protein [Planctomycetota bacterium]MBI3835578.1 DUF3313 domain-containing protein [Planctomycetota bacterium]
MKNKRMSCLELETLRWVGISAAATLVLGCAAKPPGPTGFLHDYSRLKKIDDSTMRYISPDLHHYSKFMIDPVEIHVKADALKPEQRAEVAKYMRDAMQKVLTSRKYAVVDAPGAGVARVRIAITNVEDAKWYLNIHPASKVTGAGRAQASMEAEVVDSVAGTQLAATIRAGKGKEFTLNPFSTIDDVKSAIDQWAESAGQRLDEMKKGN